MVRKRLMPLVMVGFLTLALAAGLATGGCGKKAKKIGSSAEATPTGPESSGTAAEGKNVLVVIADTIFEDAEYAAVRTALTASGYQVVVANSSGSESIGSRDTKVMPDTTIDKADAADCVAVVLIGGSGAAEYFDNGKLQAIVRDAAESGKVVAAICIAPVILANAGVLSGKRATVYPDDKDKLIEKGCDYKNESVVVDGRIITSDGPWSAEKFAQAVVDALRKE